MTALHDLTAEEQCRALRTREVTATELADHYLARIDRHDRDLGAFVTVTGDLARQEAEHADKRLEAGDATGVPLLGLPVAFKDLHPVAGVPLTLGTTAIDPVVAPADGWTVGLIRQAGAVTLGTTHAPEFGAPCYTQSAVVGRPAVTPYDTGRYASGSSGGAAAAVAAGLVPVAHGSDGAGSLRDPATVCGLVTVKPTRGRVSTAPTTSFLAWTTEGPIARTVGDAALLLDVMAHPAPSELHPWKPSGSESFVDATRRPLEGPRTIAAWTDNGLCEPDNEVVRAVEDTAALLTAHGHTVVDIANPAPWSAQNDEFLFTVFGGLVANLVTLAVAPDRQDRLEDFTRWCLERGQRTATWEFVAATDGLAAMASQFLAGVAAYDAVLTPITTSAAVPVGYFHAEGIERIGRRMLEWSAYTPLQNMTGLPAIALPVHVTSEGLPIGVQLTGARHGDDSLLLGVGAQLEADLQWHRRHPPQWVP